MTTNLSRHSSRLTRKSRTHFLLALVIGGLSLLMSNRALAQQQCPHWEQVTISARSNHKMAYDSHRNVTVVFGGEVDTPFSDQILGDTWEYDHTAGTWNLRSTTGPEPRIHFAMTYDSMRHVVVLFGGLDEDLNKLGDTWEWDGMSWSLRATTGPPAEFGYQMTFDSARGVTIMFGIWFTWEWNGSTWTLRSSGSPPPRDYFGLAYDSARGVTVLFGGWWTGPMGDTWEWDGGNWIQINVPGPSPRYTQSMTFDSIRGVVVLHGGGGSSSNPNAARETWEYDGKQWTLCGSDGPPRFGAAMTFDAQQGRSMMTGGSYSNSYGDTWAWDGLAWTELESAPPTLSSYSCPVYDTFRNVVVVFTTFGPPERWEWDGAHWNRFAVPGESPVSIERMVYDSKRDVIVSFRGAGSPANSETWEFDGMQWTLRAHSGPSPRWSHAMAYDESRGVVVLFGGTTSNVTGFDDTWEWDGESGTWTQRFPTTSATPRYTHAMAYDSARKRVVMTGGQHYPTADPQDTWEWDGTTWQFKGSDPSIGARQSMVYDSARQRIVRSGYSPGDVSDFSLYEWDGQQWTLRLPHGPYPFSPIRGMAYDNSRNTIVAMTDAAQTLETRSGPGNPGDVTCDLLVNVGDLMEIINQWGPCAEPCPPSCHNDIAPPGGDCQIGVPDLLAVINNWSSE